MGLRLRTVHRPVDGLHCPFKGPEHISPKELLGHALEAQLCPE